MSPDMLVQRAQPIDISDAHPPRLAIPVAAARRSDRDIAADVVARLRRAAPRLSRGIVPIIRLGEVSLLGYVDSDLQRLEAQKAVRRVRGVSNVIDLMVLRPGT
jgi:osmotically-inducible protein OsmY